MKNTGSEINYLFFSFLFLFLLSLTFLHFSRMSTPIWGAPLFFLLYAFGQALLEVFCFMLIGYALHRWTSRWIFKLYIGLSFTLLLAHYTNYTLVRLMDVPLSYFFKFFFGRGLDHFRIAFSAMNMNATMIAIIIITIILVPLLGIGFYWLTHKVSLKKPLMLTQKQILFIIAALGLTLFFLDILAKPYLSSGLYDKYKKTLPLSSTFLSPAPSHLSLPSPIRHVRRETDLRLWLNQDSFPCSNHPNIYLFVAEALRSDFLTDQTSPNLCAFADQNLAPSLAFSNANTTNISWFSIFHSNYPYNWTEVRDSWTHGSIPLQILKKMGYRIRVYSAADLAYFNMDEVVFGQNRELADTVRDFSKERIEPCERDRLAVEAMTDDALQDRAGTVYITFLDSTHSEYSSPPNFCHPFQPAAESIDYLVISQSSHDLDLLKNRYRNAIFWVDHLIGTFFKKLQDERLYEESIIVFTGDHGEEFFEDGALFHGTHINTWQTKIPLYYKIPSPHSAKISPLSTQLDIFPTILHSLTGQSRWDRYFDGQSLFQDNRWPYAISVQHNGPDVPYEFSLSDGQIKLYARFLNPPSIYSIPGIELITLETAEGQRFEPVEEIVRTRFLKAFDQLISNSSPE
jgi:glucan phosphoethanolaminetransferase (alkaline phosphatase superfamily)